MRITVFISAALLCLGSAFADPLQEVVEAELHGLKIVASDDPYSRTIKRMYMGWDGNQPKIGLAYREIESFKPITGVVIVEKTDQGYVLKKALFPDINKIKNAKDRKQVQAVLNQFTNVPFDPHAEKSAVDGLSGATRYGIKTSGYLNYMARRIALEMENPAKWAKP